ncbi:MAG: radical SAM protein [Desulfomonile tiedjei]|nr:radical SAM protein [Desulfomonile tiedjei]
MKRAHEALKLSKSCRLCPRTCGVDRTAGETGYCGAGPQPAVAAHLPHFGEEPPLSCDGGAGTIFFSHCNLSCVYCQNHQISQEGLGSIVSPLHLSRMILELRDAGCANIEPVSPSHHLPGLLEALAIAADCGMALPIVYNTNGYESLEVLDLLNGIVDIYVPDLKYSREEGALEYSDAGDYVETARKAIVKMHDQVGDLVIDARGRGIRGLILRHLVLPEDISGTAETLLWIRNSLPRTITLSLMAQYSPLHQSRDFLPLDRRLSADEYENAVDLAWELGLKNVFVQDLDSHDRSIPDFRLDKPFNW